MPYIGGRKAATSSPDMSDSLSHLVLSVCPRATRFGKKKSRGERERERERGIVTLRLGIVQSVTRHTYAAFHLRPLKLACRGFKFSTLSV